MMLRSATRGLQLRSFGSLTLKSNASLLKPHNRPNVPKTPVTMSQKILTYIATEGPKTRNELRKHFEEDFQNGNIDKRRKFTDILQNLQNNKRLRSRKVSTAKNTRFKYYIHSLNPYIVENPYELSADEVLEPPLRK